ncbi:site-specific integrase [Cellvibrio mixtus]|uniref:site-specific integrase n=1 Tax=Cellvibrio mixtus TaxID=39650 RepID=UPI0006944270|nr:site-specific integrase [Cellvibrio mixtus]
MEDLSKRSHLLNRNGHYYLRVRVPVDLVDRLKKTEIKRSLKTKDSKEAKARLQLELLKVEEEFQKLRRQLLKPTPSASVSTPLTNHISNTDLERAVLIWHRKESAKSALEDDQLRISISPTEKDAVLDNLKDDLAALSNADEVINASSIQATANKILDESAIDKQTLNREQAQYFYNLIRQARLEQIFESFERFGEFFQRKPSSLFTNTQALAWTGESIPSNDVTLEILLQRFRSAKRSDGLTEKSLAGYKLTFDFVVELFGKQKPIKSLTPADCREFRDKLAQLPSNAKKKYPHLTLMQAIETCAKGSTEALSATSVNGHMKNLSAIFNFAVREQLLDTNPANHIPQLKVKRNKKGRIPFNHDELHKLFSTPIYTGCKDDEHSYNVPGENKPRRHRFWVPLIALYTGMRLNEICQLFTDDIECINGIHAIHVRVDEDETKTLKTDHSERIIPIHKNLIEIGFLEYVNKIKAQNKTQLFPDLSSSARDSLSDNFSKWFNRFLIASNLKRAGLCFHSFRHTFRDECRAHNINKEIAATLGGWKHSEDVMDNYGMGYELKVLQDAINKIHSDLQLIG